LYRISSYSATATGRMAGERYLTVLLVSSKLAVASSCLSAVSSLRVFL